MKKKNGFTLVELIGVILLLSFLTILIVPNILRIVEKNRQSSFEESVKGLIRAVQNHYATTGETFPEDNLDILDISFSVSSLEKFIGGTISDDNGTLTVINVTDGEYYANGKRNSLIITDVAVSALGVYDLNDFNNWQYGRYSSTTGIYEAYENHIALKEYLYCKGSTTYEVNLDPNSYKFIIIEMDADKNFISSIGIVSDNGTFKTSAKTAYLAVSAYDSSASLDFDAYKEDFESGLTLEIVEQ